MKLRHHDHCATVSESFDFDQDFWLGAEAMVAPNCLAFALESPTHAASIDEVDPSWLVI
ncbi:hypothetical protein [Dokdonella sp.]|uniref:hypothetical protein n=1 Tax=Dokdonella sp. TaxID=2291710 RepID=UPI0025C2D267|nr:hypothetical protein [Dokdonella sp.]MBX3688755.1 hypothetical protein [Dokdonella sp.]